MDENGLTIPGALEELKNDIRKMQEQHSDGNKPMFLIEEGELELKLVARKSGGAETGFKLYLFNNEIHGKLAKKSIRTLKIKCKAIDSNGAIAATAAVLSADTVGRPTNIESTPIPTGTPVISIDKNNFPGD